MPDFRDYRITIKLLSPVSTEWHSDTIWGHLAWQILFRDGEEKLMRFIKQFESGNPPFVLSDAFPSGLMPRPILPMAFNKDVAKKLRKSPYVSFTVFLDMVKGNTTAYVPAADPWKTVTTPHAAIDRDTWTTTPNGQFYQTYSKVIESQSLDLYIRVLDGSIDFVQVLLEYMSKTGFGKDKSVGSGQFKVVSCCPISDFSFQGNGFVSLSTFVPASDDPLLGRWRSSVKRGYLGECSGDGNPYKRPYLQFHAGSAFFTDSTPKPFYGRSIPSLAAGLPSAVQCCLAFAVPCTYCMEKQ